MVETNGAPDARGRRARERRIRDARKKKLFPRRRVRRRVATRHRRSVRRCVTGRAIARFDRSRVVDLPHSRRLGNGRSRAWTIIRDDARATTTRDDATRDATRDNKIKSHRSRRLARHRASRSSPFDRSIHPSARIRATSPAVVRPARTTVDIPRADCASHARGKSIDTHVRPGGSPSHYFDDVKCYLFRVDNTVSRINDPRLWTLCTMVDPVHDTERHPQRRARPGSLARALDRSIVRSIDRNRIAADYVARRERSDVAERPARGVRERKGTRASERANARTRRDGATAIDRAIDCLISRDRMGWMITHRTGGATRAGCVREDRARERMRGGDDRGARRGARSRGRVDVGVGWSIGGGLIFGIATLDRRLTTSFRR